ncbi:MAG: pyridoxal-phosphate dependent enzyme, partial [Candidatus Acidiferrales bacterium]
SLAIGNPADGIYATRVIRGSGGWAADVSDSDIVAGIELLAGTEGIFTETAGGVTVACAQALIEQGHIGADEETVLCITGNGLKTTDALADRYTLEEAIEPKLAVFEKFLGETVAAAASA